MSAAKVNTPILARVPFRYHPADRLPHFALRSDIEWVAGLVYRLTVMLV
jgi:hypothetical protein